MNIGKDEKIIQGSWIVIEGNVVFDDNENRIEILVNDHLKKIANDDTGWNILYVDPDDGRLWEVLYLHSEYHGGGPRTLKNITKAEAKVKYKKIDKY
jgi:hypothetical protein